MSKNPNFANREVADLILSNYANRKVFMNIDWGKRHFHLF